MTVLGQPGDPARTFADRIVDSLENQVRAADFAKECNMRRDRQEFRRARQAADRAYELYPHHPSTSQCLSYVFEGTQESADSVLWAYENWTRGDSLHMRAWENLAREAQRAGDTARAVAALSQQLAANPTDTIMRFQLAAGLHITGDFDRALVLVNEGLEQVPESIRFIRLKGQICLDQERLDCALEAWTQRYDLDTTMVGDTVFYRSMFMMASQIPDSSAMLAWSTRGLEYQPDLMAYLQARGALLRAGGFTDSALTVYEHIVELNPQDLNAVLFVTSENVSAFAASIDTTAGLDEEALADIEGQINHLMTFAEQMPQIVTAVGGEYMKIVQRLAALQFEWGRVVSYSELALEHDPDGVLNAPANFFLGFGLFQTATAMDARIIAAESCSMIDPYERDLRRAHQAITVGRSVSEETAAQLLGILEQYLPRPEQLRASFCGRN
ncbi:MAG: hypothetical protein QNJ97_29130 [Myxococcota bacterium]|nr:hypothetical protein [Myxococcota bacterium]